jgi:hypothetical protein
MPLFVTEKDVFVITVRYTEKDGAITYFDPGQQAPEGTLEEHFTFRKPTWSDSRMMMSETMFIDPASGSPVMDPYRFMDKKIKILLKGWSLKNGNEPLPLSPENIDKLDASLINHLNKRLDDNLTPKAPESASL